MTRQLSSSIVFIYCKVLSAKSIRSMWRYPASFIDKLHEGKIKVTLMYLQLDVLCVIKKLEKIVVLLINVIVVYKRSHGDLVLWKQLCLRVFHKHIVHC